MQPQSSSSEYNNYVGKCNSNRPENRSTIISKKFQKYNTTAALSAVRFIESSSIREEMGYTFYWNRKTSDRSESSMAFTVRKDFLPSTSKDSKPVSVRLMILRFWLVVNKYGILIAANTPTMTNSSEKKHFLWQAWPDTSCYPECKQNCPSWWLQNSNWPITLFRAKGSNSIWNWEDLYQWQSARQDMTQGQFFKWSLTVLNSEFCFS